MTLTPFSSLVGFCFCTPKRVYLAKEAMKRANWYNYSYVALMCCWSTCQLSYEEIPSARSSVREFQSNILTLLDQLQKAGAPADTLAYLCSVSQVDYASTKEFSVNYFLPVIVEVLPVLVVDDVLTLRVR